MSARSALTATTATPPPGRLCFHGFVIDRERWEVRGSKGAVKLSRRSFDVLCYLIDHRDRVVSKAELLDALWSGRVVEESNLSQHVFLIRKALPPQGCGTKLIETVMRRGYRFVAETLPMPESAAAFWVGVPNEPAAAEPRIPRTLRWFRQLASKAVRAGGLSLALAMAALERGRPP